MNNFTINENDWSFKYLHKVSKDFRSNVRYAQKGLDIFLPKNFCDYWRLVSGWLLFHITLLIFVLFILKCTGFFLMDFSLHLKMFENDKLFQAQSWFIRLKLIVGFFGSIILSGILTGASIFGSIIFVTWTSHKTGLTNVIGDYYLNKQNKNNKSQKKDGLFLTWYKARKEKYCPTITFELNKKE